MNAGLSGTGFAANFRTDHPAPPAVTGLAKGQFAAARIVHGRSGHGITEIPPQRAFVFSYVMNEFSETDLWIGGRPTRWEPAKPGQVHFYDLESGITANIEGGLDFVYLYLPVQMLDEFSDEHELPRINGCPVSSGAVFADPVVARVARSLLPALDQPKLANQLFVDQLAYALQSNFARQYARLVNPRATLRGGLAPWQERRVTELLQANVDGEIPVAQLARECGLSRSQFFRAFKWTTGKTPHQWLLQYRIELSKSLLSSSKLSLGDIALACGFSSLSHFSRVFSAHLGTPPGAWRTDCLI